MALHKYKVHLGLPPIVPSSTSSDSHSHLLSTSITISSFSESIQAFFHSKTVQTRFNTINMKFTLITALSIFGAAIAAPLETRQSDTVQLSIINDISGANANAAVPTNNTPQKISELFAGTSVSQNGNVLASSLQLIRFKDNSYCYVTQDGATIATLTGRQTFFDLYPNSAQTVDITAATVTCN
ncbi:hypothetical protein K491DRAFT_693939 [Lophiostoma macrostomum CBS 122681]|uniref:Uncharacterized protein n=1 Tax=Lophiostoma macrostomum CBS 122681 TaxID=1314788 RepID=A0A6A6T5U9_9PLEO|nr:hypothetical protein K491DRAFT_693939 [Lophiostoma macrostomum CBS 122681]